MIRSVFFCIIVATSGFNDASGQFKFYHVAAAFATNPQNSINDASKSMRKSKNLELTPSDGEEAAQIDEEDIEFISTFSSTKSNLNILRCDAYHCEREVVDHGMITFRNPSTNQVMIIWEERPRNVLLLMKPDDDLIPGAVDTIDFLQVSMGLKVFVEENFFAPLNDGLLAKRAIETETDARSMDSCKLEVFQPMKGSRGSSDFIAESPIDIVVTLGGDGLLMHSSAIFRESVPPHLCFNMGSMGFLTPFKFESLKEEVKRVVDGTAGVRVSLRMRLSAKIIRDGKAGPLYHALNEVSIGKGPNSLLSLMDCFCDDEFLTTVQADGLIIATPTGSTAYSMSAGGSMVHPSVPAILFTPICPHSLSFRPLIFPDSVILRCVIPSDGRSTCVISFDGKDGQHLKHGDSVVIRMSNFPVPTVCLIDSTADWFSSLDGALGILFHCLEQPTAAMRLVVTSLLTEWEQCPLQFKRDYLQKLLCSSV